MYTQRVRGENSIHGMRAVVAAAVLISGITRTLLQYKQKTWVGGSCICQSEREEENREERESRPEENQRRGERNTNIYTLLSDLLI